MIVLVYSPESAFLVHFGCGRPEYRSEPATLEN